MKRIKILLVIIVGLLLIISGSGCKKAWFDVNRDTNRAVESNITPDLVAPIALLNTANRVNTGFGFLGNWMGYWCPAANYAPNVEEQSYNITTNFGAGLFTGIMDNSYDYVFMQKRAQESQQTFYEGISRIMKSHNFAQLVDIYNEVPYSEALQGLENIRPRYDNGRSVYEDLIKQIDTGINLIKNAVASKNLNLTNADIMFGGDQIKWVKFANTLKLRLLMHQANRSDRNAYVQAEVAKIVAEGSGFLGSGEDASVNPGFQADKPSIFYSTYGFTQTGTPATDFWRANIIAMNYLKNNNDPRLGAFYKPIVNPVPTGASEPFPQPTPNNYRGNQYGLGINNVTYPYQTANYVSQVGGISSAGATSNSASGLIKGFNQRTWILTSVESMFLQAEAVLRGFLPGNDSTAYTAAVLESFRWLNVGGSLTAANNAFNTWYTDAVSNKNYNVAFKKDTTVAAKSNTLFFQKYLALNGIAHLETWTDYRRNGGYPNIPLSVNPGRTSSTLPYRLLYPQAEINLNTDNVPQVGRKSGDQFSNKIWWMP